MKKLLLIAASALLMGGAVVAQETTTYYLVRDKVTSPEQLVDGKYAITVESSGIPTSGLYRRAGQTIMGIFGEAYENVAAAGDKGIAYFTNPGYVWNVANTTDDKFTLQAAIDNKYFSAGGDGANGGPNNFAGAARFRPYATDGGGNTPNTTAAEFVLYRKPNAADGAYLDGQYNVRIMNATFVVAGPPAKNDNPCLYTTDVKNDAPAGTNKNLSYWGAPNAGDHGGLTFTFNLVEEATEDDFVDVEVAFPDFGGVAMVKTVKCLKNANATPFINEVIAGMGGLENAQIVGSGADLIATEGATFTVTGDWICDFEPNEVYRVVVNPTLDSSSALRYMIEAQTIRTHLDDKASVARIVPERLWYFEPVENEPFHFYMRTIYDPTKGIYYPEPYSNGEEAQLSETPTKLELVSKTDLVEAGITYPQFFLKIAESDDYYLNDYGGVGNIEGTLKLYQHPADTDAGTLFRLYPMTADDKAQIGFDGDALATNPDFITAVNEWNAQNVRAALRRIDFYSQKDLIGSDPGQINNPAGNLVEKLAEAREVAKNLDDGVEVDAALQAELTAALDWTKFIVNPVVAERFYRFKNVSTNRYISSTTYNNAQRMDLTTDGKRSNTVFFYTEKDGKKQLICYDNGLVLNKFVRNTNWVPVLNTNNSAADNLSISPQDNAAFTLHMSGNVDSSSDADHRHLYGGSNRTYVDCSGNAVDNDHLWYVETVNVLPVTFYNIIDDDDDHDDAGWTSVYAPVALEVPANEHITAYTGQFVQDVNAEKGDVQHILATEIEPNGDGKVIIPAGQVALLFYDGKSDVEGDDDLDPSLMPDRRPVIYAYLPIVNGYEGELAEKGNLTGSYFAFAPEAGKEYYTLHASYNNYFRKYTQFVPSATSVPGFKANIPMATGGEEYYQISTFDPNKVIPEVVDENGADGLTVEESTEEGKHLVTVTLDSDEYVVFFKHTPAASAETPANVRRRAAEVTVPAAVKKEGFEQADKNGNEHTFVVEPGTVDYYAYHTGKNVTSAVRSFLVTSDGDAVSTGIKSVLVNMNGKQVIFDLQGRRMAAPAKGISIINGQKTLVK